MSAIEAALFDNEQPQTCEPHRWYVRIKPYNKHGGLLLRSLTLSAFGFRIKEENGWRKLLQPSPDLLRALYDYRNGDDQQSEHAPKAFDVCTFEEARALERREREMKIRKAEIRADVDHASVLTTGDLPSNRTSRAEQRRINNERTRAEARAEREERDARRSRSPEQASQAEADRIAERDRLEREKAAADAELAAMDAEDEALARDKPQGAKPKSDGKKGKKSGEKAETESAPPERERDLDDDRRPAIPSDDDIDALLDDAR